MNHRQVSPPRWLVILYSAPLEVAYSRLDGRTTYSTRFRAHGWLRRSQRTRYSIIPTRTTRFRAHGWLPRLWRHSGPLRQLLSAPGVDCSTPFTQRVVKVTSCPVSKIELEGVFLHSWP